MTNLSRGNVLYVRFQFTNRAAAKNRPAVVISSEAYHSSRDDVIIAGITSNLDRTDFIGHVIIKDWESAGLRLPSAVSGIIQTVRRSVIGEQLGAFSPSDIQRVDEALKVLFGLH